MYYQSSATREEIHVDGCCEICGLDVKMNANAKQMKTFGDFGSVIERLNLNLSCLNFNAVTHGSLKLSTHSSEAR